MGRLRLASRRAAVGRLGGLQAGVNLDEDQRRVRAQKGGIAAFSRTNGSRSSFERLLRERRTQKRVDAFHRT